jgi:hypothetical protein
MAKTLAHDAPLIAGRCDPSGRLVFATAQDRNVVRWRVFEAKILRRLTVTFSGPVNFTGGLANAAAAFQLKHLTDGNNVALAAAVSTNGAGQTVVTLTFSGAQTDPESALNGGGPGPGGGLASLADGLYQLTVLSADVADQNGTALAGDGVNPGTDYASASDAYQGHGLRLYRLFGDITGDGKVDQTDLDLFHASFHTWYGDQLYRWYMDANNDGYIFTIDLTQFGQRNNTSLFP